jgi:hypothetical protein
MLQPDPLRITSCNYNVAICIAPVIEHNSKSIMGKKPIPSLLEIKTSRIEIRVSDRELWQIDTFASEIGLTRSDYLRARGLKEPHLIRRNIAEPNYIALAKTLNELKAQGNNLNQLTRALHTAMQYEGVSFDLEALEAALIVNQQATQAILEAMQ